MPPRSPSALRRKRSRPLSPKREAEASEASLKKRLKRSAPPIAIGRSVSATASSASSARSAPIAAAPASGGSDAAGAGSGAGTTRSLSPRSPSRPSRRSSRARTVWSSRSSRSTFSLALSAAAPVQASSRSHPNPRSPATSLPLRRHPGTGEHISRLRAPRAPSVAPWPMPGMGVTIGAEDGGMS